MLQKNSIKKETSAPEVHTHKAHTRPPLVRTKVIAAHFGVHPRTVALWAESGAIPVVRVGGSMRFDFDEVTEFLNGRDA